MSFTNYLLMSFSEEIISKLPVGELKKFIKQFVKEKAIGTLKKSELLEHAMQLLESGTPKDKEMTGAGIADLWRSQKQDFSNEAQKTLDIFGDRPITSIKLFKHPISDISRIGTDIFTLNKMKKLQTKYGIDDLFHIGFIITLDKKKEILVEKHHVVMIKSKFDKLPDDEQMINVSLQGKELSLNEMMTKTIEGYTPEKFFIYNGLRANCQMFVTAVMEYNGLLTPELHKWSNQSMTEIIKELPFYTEKLMNAFTGTLARVDNVLGRGEDVGATGKEDNAELLKYQAQLDDRQKKKKDDNDKLLATVAKNQKAREVKVNKDKHIQSKDYQDVLDEKQRKRELLHDEMIVYFLDKDRYTREQMKAIPEGKLYAEYYKERVIDRRIKQGFKFSRSKDTYTMNGIEYKASEIAKMDEVAAAQEVENDLYRRANKMNFYQDTKNGLWYMNNETLGARQYIETPDQAYTIGYPTTLNSKGKYGVLLDAMYVMNYMYIHEDAYWDYDRSGFVKFSKDIFNQIDDFTGGLLNKALSYVPGPYDLGVKAIQNASKFMTGSKQGNIGDLLQGAGVPEGIPKTDEECLSCKHCRCRQSAKDNMDYQKERYGLHQTHKMPDTIFINPKIGSGLFSKLASKEVSL